MPPSMNQKMLKIKPGNAINDEMSPLEPRSSLTSQNPKFSYQHKEKLLQIIAKT
jgi:hypothetical protein